jgi:hypothetical protein
MMNQSTMTEADWVCQRERKNGRDSLMQVQSTLARAQQEIDYLLDKYQHAESDAERARTISYCIEFMMPFLTNNMRIDLLAQRQAELLVLAKTVKDA